MFFSRHFQLSFLPAQLSSANPIIFFHSEAMRKQNTSMNYLPSESWRGLKPSRAIVVGLCLMLLLGCGKQNDQEESHKARTLRAAEISIPVRTLAAAGGTVIESLSVQGRLEVWRQEIINAPVGGIIREFPALPDQAIKAGELILRLDPPLVEAEEVAKATIMRDRAERALKRLEYLKENAPVTVSASDLEAARDSATDAATERERLTSRQSKRRIVAPFTGVLVKFEGVVGSVVSEGMKIAELLDHSRYRIRLELPETTLRRLQLGQTVEIRALSDDSSATGTVASIPAAIDAEKGTGQVVIDTTTPPATWRPGGFATARLVLKQTTGAVVLPRDKIFTEENRTYCWTTETRDGHLVARRNWIDTGASDETKLIITKGLNAGDQVIIEGLAGISDGVSITLDSEEKKEGAKEDKKEDKKEAKTAGTKADSVKSTDAAVAK